MKKKKVLKIISNVIVSLIVLFVAYLVVEIILGFVQGHPPCIFNHYIFVVQTKSMEPTINAKDVIFVRRTDFSSAQVGDIITFLDINPSDPIYGQYVTHRINSINADGNFITLGDNNMGVCDKLPVTPDNFVGVVAHVSPFLGKIVTALTGNSTFIFIFVIIILFIIIGLEVKNIFMIKEKEKLENSEKEKIKEEILKELKDKE